MVGANMSDNFRKEDLRVYKTHKALMATMSDLLKSRNFAQITVNDLCEEAQISRATFYSHYTDKYDLLKQWLASLKSTIIHNQHDYEEIEKNVNSNSSIIRNLVKNANSEASELVCDFMFSLLNIQFDETDSGKFNQERIVLTKFLSGGIMNYLSWQVDEKFPEDVQMMNPYIYNILNLLIRFN